MAHDTQALAPGNYARVGKATTERPLARWILIGISLVFLLLILLLPLAAVFFEALRKGPEAFLEALADRDERSAHLADNAVVIVTQADPKATPADMQRVAAGYRDA